ncbi:MAG: NADH-quinone oxidoreductase subunit J [Opitutales bacterium]
MNATLAILSALLLVSAIAAFSRRNLIHSALLLTLTWASVAGFYLWAGAEFVAFAQVLIYVGAISMVVLFAVLLTRPSPADALVEPASRRRAFGAIFVGALVAVVLVPAVLNTRFAPGTAAAPTVTVRELGQRLMGPQAAALLVVGVILTVALLGATILAATDRPENPEDAP